MTYTVYVTADYTDTLEGIEQDELDDIEPLVREMIAQEAFDGGVDVYLDVYEE
jgi:hypothetical protein